MDLILLILAIVYAIGRPRIRALTPDHFPNVPAERFEEWKRLELLSRDIVIWIGFGWIAVEVVILIILGRYVLALAAVALPVLLLALIIAAVFGSKAARIKRQFNIEIPR